ncbi:CoA-transferase family III [Streptoalloteichus tenebrarius]|uniref:CoA-transferase family III n=1 Tax=Streptoalloteichus tenebrarius (strain ATCC 17920 / DSM 40477 / JCM 4838 / CBS 697.72 / NBRC 16177 / NCIMB 11028 / NRRL B-12390 / A12253. 1 / ISP 5477) TaxID=1933 RepID=A0ABT1HWD1_STRSD|nr:CoA transferase [Streptoalloteichus tenebrarius]MCP2259832.1 CoA-transferase family III [Streptoalloteichus tenebrarius]BFE99218.1 CoA transferase [Streptoalloteichus tenebrarius]
MSDLTQKIIDAVEHPLTTDEGFDVHAALDEVLGGVGLSASDAGGAVTFRGADPVVPSTLRLGAVPAIGLTAKSVALAALWRQRGGAGQDITMDLRKAPHRLCPFYDRRWEKLNGFSPGTPHDPNSPFSLAFYRTRDDRWVMPLNIYPGLKRATMRLLRCWDDADAVARAIARWDAAELERAGEEAGVVMPMLRTTREFLAEPQYRDVLAHLPLIEIEKIGDSDPEPLPAGATQPLDGVRALGMGHVIAGAGIGRDLAQHGADVLNLWRPTEWENDVTYYSANVGVRSATVDPYSTEGAALVRSLLRDADVFFANRRGGFLERIGLSAHEAAEIRPGLIHANVSLHGETGPWARRVGFDQSAGCVTGTMFLEGDGTTPQLPPIKVVNDYVLSWLATTGIVRALMLRATEGGSYRVHVSLTRVAAWILSLGVFDRDYAHAVAGRGEEHAYLDPDVFTAQTACGVYQGVTDQVVMSGTPGRFRTVLVPRGSGSPVWLPR